MEKSCRVLSAEPISGKVEVALRKSMGSKSQVGDISYSDLHVGDIVDGKVKRVESYGLFVTIRSSELVCFCTLDRQVVISNWYSCRSLFRRWACVIYQNFLMNQFLILTLASKLVIWLKPKF